MNAADAVPPHANTISRSIEKQLKLLLLFDCHLYLFLISRLRFQMINCVLLRFSIQPYALVALSKTNQIILRFVND